MASLVALAAVVVLVVSKVLLVVPLLPLVVAPLPLVPLDRLTAAPGLANVRETETGDRSPHENWGLLFHIAF
jgi:hypothetical protein